MQSRANTELQLIKLVADVLNSKPTDWPDKQINTPAAHRLVNIVERCRAGICPMAYDHIAYKAVAGAAFAGLRFYGVDRESGKHYHILNLSYDAIDAWYQQ